MTDETNDESRARSAWHSIAYGSGTAKDYNNQRKIIRWSLAWAGALIGATWLIETFEGLTGGVSWVIALIPIATSIGALMAYLVFLRNADEMQRRMQIEGLAVGFGGGWFFAISYQVLERAGAPELSITALILVMTGAWMVGQWLAIRRYQ